jgi:hypothetical protein
MSTQTRSIADEIPDPDTLRKRLSMALREAALLRQLLRVSERAVRERQQRDLSAAATSRGGAHA